MRLSEIFENQQALNEATFDLNDQVDFIYDNYFAEFVNRVNRNETQSLAVPYDSIPSTDLPENDVISKANQINPVTIKIGDALGNQYIPHKNLISVSYNKNALDFLQDQGGIERASAILARYDSEQRARAFRNEFTEHRIKGSIYHELSHWLDDTFHNTHIRDKLTRANTASSRTKGINILRQRQPDVALTNYERDAQIHSIKQQKRTMDDNKWNSISFEQMIRMNPSLEVIYDNGKQQGWFNKWKKMILRRMNREGLLGDNMR